MKELTEEQKKIFKDFGLKLLRNQKEMDKEIATILYLHFWELLENKELEFDI